MENDVSELEINIKDAVILENTDAQEVSKERIIENPYWSNKEDRHLIVEFVYPATKQRMVASIKDTDGKNPDFIEVMEKFTIEEIDKNTQVRIDHRNQKIKHQVERQKVNRMRMEQEALFAAKLDAFEIDKIKNSKNRELKSKIRKAKTVMEVTAYSVLLIMREEENVLQEISIEE